MRESAGSWIIKILLGLIVLAFVFVGTGTYNSGKASKIGSVNGSPITINDYQTAYYNILGNLRQQFGGQLNDEIIKMFNVQQQAIDQVIEAELMRQAAERVDIIVSNQELIESITRIPAFQEQGIFDKERYRLLLSQNRLTPESFEIMQKEAILFNKLRTIVAGSVKVSEEEARTWYEWENTAVAIAYASFDPQTFTDIELTDEMLAS
jgi:peptidyl-prolyl cis-trans isomerase D